MYITIYTNIETSEYFLSIGTYLAGNVPIATKLSIRPSKTCKRLKFVIVEAKTKNCLIAASCCSEGKPVKTV